MPDAALARARDIVNEMLASRPDLRATLVGLRVRVAVMAEGSVITDLPEFSDLNEAYPGVDWDERTRGGGLGATLARPLTAIAEENLLCYESDPYPDQDILVHEFAHSLLLVGIEQQAGGAEFRARLESAYGDAMDAGLWQNTYAAQNPDEYWAEGVQSWFGLNDPPAWIDVFTRVELETYDPALAILMGEVFGNATVSASCHGGPWHRTRVRGVAIGPDGEPLEGIGVRAWQWEGSNSKIGRTGPDGTFDIRVPDGAFVLAVYADPGCSFIGWYDGSGITTSHDQAASITVQGASVEGVEIQLPTHSEASCSLGTIYRN